ncbi:SDR family oxidoreductase [Massilia sp. IC2-476]|uniref:SDR family NAD(P)-dependent oxidoreductase n=1 Tax=Massilia sp. IC2-476 TaxID=2887199 RepID=UPI001D0F5A0C|nr:SDR family NAD(P)-dependent oxidoreductase [Massilia sp. IC2-476]MCC2971832.1 SDR family NAD(P)-dependent oxidoreductase [Massilia sp. IC2-476]
MNLFRLDVRGLLPRACLACILLLLAVLLGGCATTLSSSEGAQVAGKTYVVTGASSGFGRGVAERLGALRANVVLAARRVELLNEVAARVNAAGGSALVVQTDVARAEEVQRLLAATVARYGRVDVWINNAAVGAIGVFDAIPLEDHARIVDVNLKGVIYGSHVALRQFKAQGGGTLVNIGSVESEVPLAYHASYASTKAAVLGLGRALNEELRLAGVGERIKVATVMPWAADTPFFANAANYSGHRPRMLAMDDPSKVVEVIVRASLTPSEEVPAGWKARGAVWSHKIAPDLTERISANIAHAEQFEKAPPTPTTSGGVHQPNPAATGIDGGVRARMRQEDEARKTGTTP